MPLLSGFLPIPLAMMIPFMGSQSLVIGKQFGEGFQYGKRKISAMTNEEFNKLTPQKIAQDNAEELRQMIPSMKSSIQDMREFQTFIVRELIETAKQLPNDIFGANAPLDIGRANDTAYQEGFGLKNVQDFYANQIKNEPQTSHISAASSDYTTSKDRNFSYLTGITLGKLQTAYLRTTDKSLKLAIYREIQLRLQANPKILKPDYVKTVADKSKIIVDSYTSDLVKINNAIKQQRSYVKITKDTYLRQTSFSRLKRKSLNPRYLNEWRKQESILKDLLKKLSNAQILLRNRR